MSTRDNLRLSSQREQASKQVEPPTISPERISVYRGLRNNRRWISRTKTEWRTIIGFVYAPRRSSRHLISYWIWIHLLLLNTDKQSQWWVNTDWVEGKYLKLLPPSFTQADPQPQEEP